MQYATIVASVVCVPVPCQISKAKRVRREISSPF